MKIPSAILFVMAILVLAWLTGFWTDTHWDARNATPHKPVIWSMGKCPEHMEPDTTCVADN